MGTCNDTADLSARIVELRDLIEAKSGRQFRVPAFVYVVLGICASRIAWLAWMVAHTA